MPEPRFYYSTNASTTLMLHGRSYKFSPTGIIAGKMNGVYEAKGEQEIGDMNEAVSRRLGVSEITSSDYSKLLTQSQTTDHSRNSLNSNNSSRPVEPVTRASLAGPRLTDRPARVVSAEENKAMQEAAAKAAESGQSSDGALPELEAVVAELKVEKVNSPEVIIADDSKRIGSSADEVAVSTGSKKRGRKKEAA